MKRSTSIQQIDRFFAVDSAGRRHGVMVYAEVVVERTFWSIRRTLRRIHQNVRSTTTSA